ncbi:neprilysin-11-like isoform X2 [Daktulosphaira vitifoliae]|nr:neprilysin-11-like isoform X2 [Daktulosphaira vitifoliae]
MLILTLVLALIGLSYSYIKQDAPCPTQDVKYNVCTTPDCLKAASLFMESMNRSIDPCNDFYEFACGNYPKKVTTLKTSTSNDRFAELNLEILKWIRAYMEREDLDSEPYSVSQARLLYRSCMATDEMDSKGLKPLIDILDKIELPRIGIMNKKMRESASTSRLLALAKRYVGVSHLFQAGVLTNSKNRTYNRITLSKPSSTTDMFPANKIDKKITKILSRRTRETLTSEENIGTSDSEDEENDKEAADFIKSFGKYVKGVWLEIYKSLTNETLPNNFRLSAKIFNILEFNNQLTELTEKVYDTDGDRPILLSVDKLQNYFTNNTKNINWREYFTVLFADVENVTLDFSSDLIELKNVEYFENLLEFLSTTTKEERILSLWWQVVSGLIQYTTNHMIFIQNRYIYETTQLENNPSRSLYCSSAVNQMMGMAVSHLLVEWETTNDSIQMMNHMMDNIQWSFKKIVNDLDWMDEETKKRTLYKASQMKTLIGYPEFITDPDLLDDYYIDYNVTENDFFENVIKYIQHNEELELKSLREINDFDRSTMWSIDPLNVNAFNIQQYNIIIVPAGILHFPFFGHDLQVLNYGFLGSILGHEITHSFDNTGRKFDEDGNDIVWWTNKTIEEYEKGTECFIKHYESFPIPGTDSVKVDGRLTLDENIADNGGIKEALMGYRKYVSDNGEESRLPGLEEYNNDQLFFLSFANNWCQSLPINTLVNELYDEHSPNVIRVTSGLANSKEFSEVWHCKEGSKMNPSKSKCQLW